LSSALATTLICIRTRVQEQLAEHRTEQNKKTLDAEHRQIIERTFDYTFLTLPLSICAVQTQLSAQISSSFKFNIRIYHVNIRISVMP